MFVALVGSLRSIEGGWEKSKPRRKTMLEREIWAVERALVFLKEFDGLYVIVWFDSFVVGTTNQCFAFYWMDMIQDVI